MLKIEKGVPLPSRRRGGSTSISAAPNFYPWDDMEIGDSFLVRNREVNRVTPAACHAAKRAPGRRYTCRVVPDGVRVWRIA